jgi:hypothetical protein
MKPNWCRTLMPAAALLAALAPVRAQQQPPPMPAPAVQQNPVCARLETQLQTFDRTNNDAARAEQLGKFEAAATSQQTEIDRQEATSRRMGCAQNRFFMMLGNQPQQCTPLNNKIQQMRDNLEKIQADAERLRGEPPPEREGQRRTILAALAQSNCGAQYQQQVAAPPPRRAGLFESLFGPRSTPAEPDAPVGGDVPGMPASGSYRTLCVRTCDGFYYPISYATSPARFAEDEKVCRASCPAAEVQLYSHPTAGGINDAVSVTTQQPYSAMSNAFRYRTSLDQSCSCRHPGESWSQALKSIDDPTVEQGDIVVNDQKARQLSAPRVDAQGRPIRVPPAPARPDPRTAQTTTQPAAQATAPAEPKTDANDTPSKPDPNRKVRDVGPTFLPGR